MNHDLIQLSKHLSFILRHDPASAGVELDSAGWIDIDLLLRALAKVGRNATRLDIDQLLSMSTKQRFEIVDNRIRAAQGHSVPVRLGLPATPPPAVLFHGTVERFWATIATEGLLPQDRTHVHLSADRATAVEVGARRGTPIVLTVAARNMHVEGHPFFLASNGVWLTEAVPARFLDRS